MSHVEIVKIKLSDAETETYTMRYIRQQNMIALEPEIRAFVKSGFDQMRTEFRSTIEQKLIGLDNTDDTSMYRTVAAEIFDLISVYPGSRKFGMNDPNVNRLYSQYSRRLWLPSQFRKSTLARIFEHSKRLQIALTREFLKIHPPTNQHFGFSRKFPLSTNLCLRGEFEQYADLVNTRPDLKLFNVESSSVLEKIVLDVSAVPDYVIRGIVFGPKIAEDDVKAFRLMSSSWIVVGSISELLSKPAKFQKLGNIYLLQLDTDEESLSDHTTDDLIFENKSIKDALKKEGLEDTNYRDQIRKDFNWAISEFSKHLNDELPMVT